MVMEVMGKMWIARKYLLGSMAVGLCVAAGLFFYLSGVTAEEVVMVARCEIEPYTLVTRNMVESRSFPAEAAHQNALSEETSVVGKYTVRGYHPGEQLLGVDLVRAGGESGRVPWQLAEDERAMAVPCTTERAAGGAIARGHLVDVLLFRESSVHGSSTGRTLLQAVEVLDVRDSFGGRWDRAESNEPPASCLLAVHPAEAEALAYALAVGEVYLTISPYHPHPTADLPGATGGNLFRYAKEKGVRLEDEPHEDFPWQSE